MTAPTFYYIGGCLDSVVPMTDMANVFDNNNAPWINASLSPGGVGLRGVESSFRVYMLDPVTQARANIAPASGVLWFHIGRFDDVTYNNMTTGTSAGRLMVFYNGAGVGLLKLVRVPGGTYTWSYWNGAAYVQIGTTNNSIKQSNTGSNNPNQIDIKFTFGVAGGVDIYVNKVVCWSVTGIDTSAWNIASMEGWGSTSQGDTWTPTWQQMCACDQVTLDYIVRRRSAPNAAGANTAWTNTYTEVDEFPNTDSDYIKSAVTGDKESYTAPAVSSISAGNDIKAVAVAARVRNDATGVSPQNLKMLIRINGVDYTSPTLPALASNFQGRFAIWHTNPTGGSWGTDISAAGVSHEFGLSAAA